MINGTLIDIKRYLKNIGTPENIIENINNNVFNEVFIKGITDSNVLARDKKKINTKGNIGGQTHIDITGKSVNFFISEDEKENYKMGDEVRKNIYIRMIKNNFDHLESIENTIEISNDKSEKIRSRAEYISEYQDTFKYIEATAIAKLGHGSGNLQGQINTPDEADEFNKFRKLIYTNDALVFLKYRNCIDEYLVLVIPNEEFNNFGDSTIISKSGNNVYSLDLSIIESNKRSKNKAYMVKYNGEIINRHPLTMTETPYTIVEHYINNNEVSFEELKGVFKECKCGNKDLILELEKKDTARYSDYFRPDKRPNLNVDGIEFGVNTQWHGNGTKENFGKFINNVAKLGYEVVTVSIEENDQLHNVEGGINKIYFGAPGTGKSNYVDETYYDDFSKRVTFHPEYTYNDFVGYIRPIVDGDDLTYKFVPGTFTEILVEALDDPYNMYTLIIEELNRANTAAVFGDLFQLLDRKSDGSSQYRVNNTDIYKHIKDEMGSKYEYNDGSIGIPSNLSIIATMNTADQNVFVMDTAFKRRWEFEYIPVDFKDNHKFKDNIVTNIDITWEKFVEAINEFMMSEDNNDLFISEDKQIGPYFVKENELNDSNKFGYKVLLYLWDDVFKMDKYKLFNKEIRTFSKLISEFSGNNSINIFSSKFANKLEEKKLEDKKDNLADGQNNE